MKKAITTILVGLSLTASLTVGVLAAMSSGDEAAGIGTSPTRQVAGLGTSPSGPHGRG